MKLKLFPFLTDEPLTASVKGDVITINGEAFDFSPLTEGYKLPGSAVGSVHFISEEFVERKAGVVWATIRFPIYWDSPEEVRNPAEPIYLDVVDGVVIFPDIAPPKMPEQEPLPVFEEVIENGLVPATEG